MGGGRRICKRGLFGGAIAIICLKRVGWKIVLMVEGLEWMPEMKMEKGTRIVRAFALALYAVIQTLLILEASIDLDWLEVSVNGYDQSVGLFLLIFLLFPRVTILDLNWVVNTVPPACAGKVILQSHTQF